MTKEELDFIGSMNMCNEISNEAYKKIVCHCECQPPCEDAVSRQAVHDVLKKHWLSGTVAHRVIDEIGLSINVLPSVTPKEKTGRWIIKDGKEQGYDIGGIKTWYIQIMCDKCGFIKTAIEGHTGQYHFCSNCGARMVEPQESEVNNG